MRRCIHYVKKDLKSSNAKVTLVEGLLDARKPVSSAAYPTILRSEKFITVLVGNSGKVLRDEIRISCEKKSSDQVFFPLCQKWAIAAISAEAAEDVAQLAISALAYLNPVEAVFVSSSLNEFTDRANKLAHTLNELGEMLIKEDTLDSLFTQSQSIKAKFNKNSEFLEVVRNLVQGITSGVFIHGQF